MKTGIKIDLPSIKLQRMEIFKQGIEQSILALQSNAAAAPYPKAKAVDYSTLDERYFLTVEQGWIAPPHSLVNAWFEQFKSTFPEYGSESGVSSLSSLAEHHKKSFRFLVCLIQKEMIYVRSDF